MQSCVHENTNIRIWLYLSSGNWGKQTNCWLNVQRLSTVSTFLSESQSSVLPQPQPRSSVLKRNGNSDLQTHSNYQGKLLQMGEKLVKTSRELWVIVWYCVIMIRLPLCFSLHIYFDSVHMKCFTLSIFFFLTRAQPICEDLILCQEFSTLA